MPASEILAKQLAKVSLNFKRIASSVALDAAKEGLSKEATAKVVDKAWTSTLGSKGRKLGVAAALGGGLALSESDAEAGVKSKMLTKAVTGIVKGVESSASKALKGTTYKDSVIKKIIKGKGNWRYVLLENDTTELVDKSVINSLARSAGTTRQVEKFAVGNQESKLAQAYKSLQMHLGKAQVEKKLILDYHSNYTKQLKLAGKPVPSMSLVKAEGKHLTLPTEYAKVLEKEGSVKIIKKLGE